MEYYKVIVVSGGGVKRDWLYQLTEEEAIQYCEEHDWCIVDDNCFEWHLDYVRDYSYGE